MKISDEPKLLLEPTLFHFCRVCGEFCRRCISGAKGLIDRLRGQHSTFDRGVNSLQALRIQQACRVTDNQAAIKIAARHRIPTAVGNRLRAVANKGAAFQDPFHKWMRFEFLEGFMRIEERIVIIESDDHSQRHAIVPQAVNPSAAVEIRTEWPTKRV